MIKQIYLTIWKKWIYFSKSWINKSNQKKKYKIYIVQNLLSCFKNRIIIIQVCQGKQIESRPPLKTKSVILTDPNSTGGHTEKHQGWWGGRKGKIWMGVFTVVSTRRNGDKGYAGLGLASLSNFRRLRGLGGCPLLSGTCPPVIKAGE